MTHEEERCSSSEEGVEVKGAGGREGVEEGGGGGGEGITVGFGDISALRESLESDSVIRKNIVSHEFKLTLLH